MSSVADVDPELTLDCKGKAYKLKRASFRCEGWLVNWVRQRAFSACETIPDPSVKKLALSTLIADIASGKYDWEYFSGQVNYVREALDSPNGLKQWFYFRLMQDNPILKAPDDGWILFEQIWNDSVEGGKQEELIQKFKAIDGPNPQIPPEK